MWREYSPHEWESLLESGAMRCGLIKQLILEKFKFRENLIKILYINKSLILW